MVAGQVGCTMSIFTKGIFGIKKALGLIREELDEHLSAINENTNEIHTNYAYTQEIDNKLNQFAARIDRLEILLEGQPKRFNIQPLTHPEKQVFLVLYTEDMPLTYTDISQRTTYTDQAVKLHLASLIEKGIPIIKSYFNSTPFMKLNPGFKEQQAKENLLNLSLKSFVED